MFVPASLRSSQKWTTWIGVSRCAQFFGVIASELCVQCALIVYSYHSTFIFPLDDFPIALTRAVSSPMTRANAAAFESQPFLPAPGAAVPAGGTAPVESAAGIPASLCGVLSVSFYAQVSRQTARNSSAARESAPCSPSLACSTLTLTLRRSPVV